MCSDIETPEHHKAGHPSVSVLSFICLQYVPYSCQGHGRFRIYPLNTGHKTGIHPGYNEFNVYVY